MIIIFIQNSIGLMLRNEFISDLKNEVKWNAQFYFLLCYVYILLSKQIKIAAHIHSDKMIYSVIHNKINFLFLSFMLFCCLKIGEAEVVSLTTHFNWIYLWTICSASEKKVCDISKATIAIHIHVFHSASAFQFCFFFFHFCYLLYLDLMLSVIVIFLEPNIMLFLCKLYSFAYVNIKVTIFILVVTWRNNEKTRISQRFWLAKTEVSTSDFTCIQLLNKRRKNFKQKARSRCDNGNKGNEKYKPNNVWRDFFCQAPNIIVKRNNCSYL